MNPLAVLKNLIAMLTLVALAASVTAKRAGLMVCLPGGGV